MIASLYQSGSSCAADEAGDIASTGTVTFGISMAIEGQNVSLADVRIEAHVVPLAAPLVLDIVQEVADREGLVRSDAGHANVAVLHVVRIEIDDHQQSIAV